MMKTIGLTAIVSVAWAVVCSLAFPPIFGQIAPVISFLSGMIVGAGTTIFGINRWCM